MSQATNVVALKGLSTNQNYSFQIGIMAGKRRKAQSSRGSGISTKSRAAKENSNVVKKRTPSSSYSFDNAGDRKHHVLNLIPIDEDGQECVDLLGNDGVSFEGKDDYEPNKRKKITLKLPTNVEDILDDFIDVDAINDDDGSQGRSNTQKRHAATFSVKYYRHNDDKYFAETTIGRVNLNGRTEISRELANVSITNDAEAWILVLPDDHRVHIDGERVDTKGRLPLRNGAVVSFYGQTYAYRVDIQSSVLVVKKNVLSRIDDVLQDFKFCYICTELYDDSDHQPIIGSCGHVLCQTCLGKRHAELLNSKPRIRYLNCDICREERTFDTQNPVKHRLLSQILQARAPESKFEEEEDKASKMGHTQVASKLSSSEAGVATRHGKSEEIDSDKEQLRKSNEALASENAQLRKRNQDLRKRNQELEAAANARPRIAIGKKRSNQEIIEIRDDDEPENATTESESNTFEQHERVDDSSNTYDIVKSKWACNFCTFQNEYRRQDCEICNTRKE